MTTIVIREYDDRYEIAADSKISVGAGSHFSYCRKITEVPQHRGGGYVLGAGDSEMSAKMIAGFIDRGELIPVPGEEVVSLIHINPSGVRMTCRGHAWFDICGEFIADGSGREYALGAFEMGATAEEAIRAAAKYDPATGGDIETKTVMKETSGAAR